MDAQSWDKRYADAELVWSADPNQFFAAEVADLPTGRGLDLGTGEGRNAMWLANQGWEVTAVDFSAVAIDKARAIAESRGLSVTWVVADMSDYIPDAGSFDLVALVYLHLEPAVHHHFGVLGESYSGNGVTGVSSTGYGGYFQGATPLYLSPASNPGAPTSGAHILGEVYVDINGIFYVCTTAGTPGTWMQLGGIGLQSFPTPRRVFHQTMTSGQVVTGIDATTKQAGGASGVPAGAHAMYAAVQSDQPGRLTLYPNGTTDPGIANWTNNGTGGILYLSYMLVPLDANGKFSIHSYITGNVYVDAWGYLP
jgi:SAM-dependent methyltransferase